MVALIVLFLLVVLFGGLGFAVNVFWWILIGALVLWALGFLFGAAAEGTSRRGWYRW